MQKSGRSQIHLLPIARILRYSIKILQQHNTQYPKEEINSLPSRGEISVCRKIREIQPREREKKRKAVSRRKCNERARARARAFISLQRHVVAGTGRERDRI